MKKALLAILMFVGVEILCTGQVLAGPITNGTTDARTNAILKPPGAPPDFVTARGSVWEATRTNGEVSLTQSKDQHWFRLYRFSVEPSNSDPKSYIISGLVKDRNAGAAAASLPVFIGSSLHPIRLAAVTNERGEFCFRAWKKEDGRAASIQVPSLADADIYIGDGNFYLRNTFDEKRELTSGLVRRYRIAELLSVETRSGN
jgi:hypothetical protein